MKTIHLVMSVPRSSNMLRRVLDKIIEKTRIMPPLYRYGIHSLIPWRKPIRSPHACSRNILDELKKYGKVRYYSLYEKGIINLKDNDILLAHPLPQGGYSHGSFPNNDDKESITSRTVRKYSKTNHNKIIFLPFANNEKLVSWAKDIVSNYADKVVLIGGEIWTKDWNKTPFAALDKSKVLRINNAVSPSDYPFVKKTFNSPEKRKFLYIGHTGWYKNTDQLEKIAAEMPGFEGGHIGLGSVKGWKKIADFSDLTNEFMQKIASEYDIFVTTSTADAQATTILEAMCFGFPIACTQETGYTYPSIVRLDTRDTSLNITTLKMMKNMPELELKKLVSENISHIKNNHTWEDYVGKIIRFINLK